MGNTYKLSADMIVKRPRTDTANDRMQIRIDGRYREATFLGSALAKEPLLQQLLPKVYLSWVSSTLGDYTVAMERVDADTLKIHVGNQQGVNGAGSPPRFFLTTQPPIEAFFKALFARTAEMHGLYWNDPALLKTEWLKGLEWYRRQGGEAYMNSVKWVNSLFAQGLKSRPSGLLSENLVERIQQALDGSTFEALQSYIHTHPYSFHHGDFHAGNILVRHDLGKEDSMQFVFVDFSEVGIFDPAFDLSQILISDLEGKYYKSLVPELVKIWHARLQVVVKEKWGKDVEINSREALKTVLCAGFSKWAFLIGALTGFPAVSDHAIQYFANNLTCWMELLETVVPKNERDIGFVKV